MVETIRSILETVNCITVQSSMSVEEKVASQKQLINVDKQLRQLRKDKPELSEKCTEILTDISYAVSIYIPKNKRLGMQIVKEAIDFLKLTLAAIESEKEISTEYRDERENCFTQMAVIELSLVRIARGKAELKNEETLWNERDAILNHMESITYSEILKLTNNKYLVGSNTTPSFII